MDDDPALFSEINLIEEVISEKATNSPFAYFLAESDLAPSPAAPVAETATNIRSVKFTANWQSVAGASSYKLFVNGQEIAGIGNNLSKTVTALNPQTAYSYYVKAVSPSGKESEPSETINLTTTLPNVTTFAGSGANGIADGHGTLASFNSPIGMDMDSNGNLFVSEYGSGLIRKITPGGLVSTIASGVGAAYDVVADNNGNLFSTNYSTAIIKIDSSGVPSTFTNSLSQPVGITIDSNNNLYVSETGAGKIKKVTPSGVVSEFATGIAGAYYMDFDSQGNLFVAARDNRNIRKITPAGDVSVFAGSVSGVLGNADGQGTAALFASPVGIAIDKYDNVYVSDFGNDLIRKITPGGLVSTLAGNSASYADGQGTNAKFNNPYGITVDNDGNLYIVDAANRRIRKID